MRSKKFLMWMGIHTAILGALIATGCGDDKPVFTENASPAFSGKSDDATVGPNIGEKTTTVATAAVGTTGATPTPAATTAVPGVDPGTILKEDGGTLDIPGVKALKVGVNFEDWQDFDFNDAVLCFTGNFKIEGTNVVSYQEQTVVADMSSLSMCNDIVKIKIVHADGTEFNGTYNAKTVSKVSLPFKIKSHLEVSLDTSGSPCSTHTVSMHDAVHTLVKPDECRIGGQ